MFWVNNGKKNVAQQIFLVGQYMSHSYWKKLLPETTYSQTQSAFICCNSAIITEE